MSQQLKALAAIAKDPDSFPRTHLATHKHLQCQVQGIPCLLLASSGTVCTRCSDIHANKAPIHIKQI